MKLIHLCTVLFFTVSMLHASDQPLISEDMMPEGQNVRLGLVHDADGDVDGDDYHGFTVSYASEIYPLDQMVFTYTQMSPENNTARQALLSIEEHYTLSPNIVAYGVAGGGYMWSSSEISEGGDGEGLIGKLGAGVIVKTRSSFDIFMEYAMLASDTGLWREGVDGSKTSNRHVVIGFRYNY